MTIRTYGTYRFEAPGMLSLPGEKNGRWLLELEPAVRMRFRRTFGKVQITRSLEVSVTNTDEVCHDLTWFMERYPLVAVGKDSARVLAAGTAAHIELERKIGAIIDGRIERGEEPQHTPEKDAREYQQQTVELLRASNGLLCTDELGLGKTFTGLLNLINADALPALIVPPTHLPERWEEELQAFPWLTYHVAASTKPTAAVAAGQLPDVLIVPYSKLDGWAGYLKGLVASVVFDEAQELRNGVNTDKGKAAALVSENATYVLGLTATPIYNYGAEIWNIMDILAPGKLGTREEFGREWGTGRGDSVADPAALGSYLREQGLMLGHTREEVGRELPKTIKVSHLVDSEYSELALVEDDLKRLAEIIVSSSSSNQEKFQASGELDWKVRRATGVDKAPFVADFVKLLLQSEDKVILFGWHRDVYDIWLDKLKAYQPVMYTGTESPKKKAEARTRFLSPLNNPEGEPYENAARVLIMSLRSGAGVDGLQKVARTAVFGELDWSPQVHEQGIGRLRRDDALNNEPPVAYFLHSAEGSDPKMLEVLGLKRQQSEPMVSRDGQLLQNATAEPARARRLAESILGITPTEESTPRMSDYPVWIQPSTETYCVAPGCSFARAPYVSAGNVGAGNAPTARFAVPGTDLCNWHHAQFPKVLADLVNMYPDLVAITYSKTSSRDENGRVGGGGGTPADVGTSWNPHAAAVLAELKDWTGYLVRMLIREFPSRVGITEDDDVRAQLRTIASWYAGWWSRYPGGVGPSVLADARQHRTVGLRAMHTEPVKRLTLKNGVCRHLIEEDELGPILCGAPLYAIIRPKDDKPSEILCSTNPRHPQLSRDAWIDAMPR